MRKICYLSSEEFTNELINSLRYEKMDEFRNKFRRMDILLIDDIQFIAGKERTKPNSSIPSTPSMRHESKSSSPAISFQKISQTLKNVFDLVLNGA